MFLISQLDKPDTHPDCRDIHSWEDYNQSCNVFSSRRTAGNGDGFQPLRNHLELGGERWRCSRSHRGSTRPEQRLGGWSAGIQNTQVEEHQTQFQPV